MKKIFYVDNQSFIKIEQKYGLTDVEINYYENNKMIESAEQEHSRMCDALVALLRTKYVFIEELDKRNQFEPYTVWQDCRILSITLTSGDFFYQVEDMILDFINQNKNFGCILSANFFDTVHDHGECELITGNGIFVCIKQN
jgi:hypothetical protein